jgi:hypothetical protein
MRSMASIACALARNSSHTKVLLTQTGLRSTELFQSLPEVIQRNGRHPTAVQVRPFVQPTRMKWMPIQTIDVRYVVNGR